MLCGDGFRKKSNSADSGLPGGFRFTELNVSSWKENIRMPVPDSIAVSAECFKQNTHFVKKNVEGLSDEEWARRPGGSGNHVLWIVGHVAWARSALLKRLGDDWGKPWLSLCGRGAKCEDSAAYPTPEEAMEAWNESSARLKAAMESASAELLATPSVQGPPSADGKLSGVVNFMAYHETYHVGQLAYLRGLFGHPGAMG
jgi:uncharacterized damage-inducible protein DinB